MDINKVELELLSNIIQECVTAVLDNNPFDAEPWIIAEENIGYDKTKILFSDPTLNGITGALELYCHCAQHDEKYVNGFAISKLGTMLLEASYQLSNSKSSILLEFDIFRKS